MKCFADKARQSVMLGHQLDVILFEDERWGVTVDGEEIMTRFCDAYDAWAVGVAESYRQGRVACSPPSLD